MICAAFPAHGQRPFLSSPSVTDMLAKHMIRTIARTVGLCASLVLAGGPAAAQSRTSDAAILDELKSIRQLLERLVEQSAVPSPQPAPTGNPMVTLPQVSGFTLGELLAPVTVVEFTDLQCPFCRRYHESTYPQIVRDYVDTGKVRYVSVDLPLSIHAFARKAARAARCAGEQERFWEMRHHLLVNNTEMSDELPRTLARDLALDLMAFDACLADTARYDREIARGEALASAARISGTPSFVVGRMTNRGLEGQLLVGAQPYETFKARLDELLGGQPAR